MGTTIDGMESTDDWRVTEKVQAFLGGQLFKRRISLMIGAGVSLGFGLPGWTDLISSAYSMAQVTKDPRHTDLTAPEVLYRGHFNGDRLAFAEHIRNVLYDKSVDLEKILRGNELLASIGALVMASSRGGAAKVITLNYDDILETYLRFRGYVVRSINQLPEWDDPVDVAVYHQHGLLPLDRSRRVDRGIVLTQADYDEVVGKSHDVWHQAALGILRSSTCIFIGLSGSDTNLTQLLTEVQGTHRASGHQPFWGLRLSGPNDPMKEIWEGRGVCNHELSSYSELPAWLMGICRFAALRHEQTFA